MRTVAEYYPQAELAFATYADLVAGVDPIPALQDENVGMSAAQAQSFSERWRVVDQYNGEPIERLDEFNQPTGEFISALGLSVTVFEEVATGKRYVAVRGTQDLADLVTDVIDVALLGTPQYQQA